MVGMDTPTPTKFLPTDKDYVIFIQAIKHKLKSTQLKAMSIVNTHLIHFYWQLGHEIHQLKRSKKHWGSQFIAKISHDIRMTNPGLTGFSKRNLEYMRSFAKLYPAYDQFAQQAAAQLPWSHIQLLIDRYKDDEKRRNWYASHALTNGWSRSSLNMHIKSKLYKRQSMDAEKTSNFHEQLP